MLEKFFMPLDRQYDDGFEAIGNAFKESAEKLSKEHEGKLSFLNGHLPINYLLRHAIELYLKSSIITLHRVLKLPTGKEAHTKDPLIRDGEKWREIDNTHSLKCLLSDLTRILTEQKTAIASLTPTNWLPPPELSEWIESIETADSRSTYFRYPKERGKPVDGQKSGFLPADPQKLLAEMRVPKEGKPGKVILGVKDSNNNLVEAFAMSDNPMPELRVALENATNILWRVAFGLQAELVYGYGKKFLEEAQKKTASGGVDLPTPSD